MTVTQNYLGVELPDEKFAKPQNFDLKSSDVNELVAAALDEPLDFPRLRDSVFPGDKIVVVLQSGLPKPRPLVAAIARYLDSTEINPDDVTYLSSYQLDPPATDGPEVVVHDAGDEQGTAYIAANLEGQPILINRALFDADVILPVCMATTIESDTRDCIYPEFSAADTRTRFQDEKGTRNARATEVETANNSLGIFFALRIVAGPGDEIAQAFFGRKELVESTAGKTSDECWTVNSEPDSRVVVATIESLPARQNWEHVFHAIVAANRMAPDCDQLVLLSKLSEKPKKMTRAMLQLQFETDTNSVNRVMRKASATQKEVAEIVREKTVYLKSELPESVVESVGLGFIKTDEELQRLLDKFDSGVLLRDAHFCRVQI